jgi:predicted outer membrane protein
MKHYVALGVLLASVSAVPASAQVAPAQVMDSQTYRMMAAQADAFEIASSQLALERSRNPAVRRYAETMIKDHGMTSQALNGGRPVYSASGEFIGGSLGGTLAGAGIGAVIGGPVGAVVGAGVGAAAGATAGAAAGRPDVQTTGSTTPIRLGMPLSPEKTALLNQLASTSGPQFDRLYGQAQRQAHQEALALHSQAGNDPTLRPFAASVVPHIEHHAAEARRLPGGSARR